MAAIDAYLGGVLVRSVTTNGPAVVAGLKVGDRILAIDKSTIRDVGDLVAALAAHAPGDRVQISIARGSTTTTLQVALTRQLERAATDKRPDAAGGP